MTTTDTADDATDGTTYARQADAALSKAKAIAEDNPEAADVLIRAAKGWVDLAFWRQH